jgi:NTP pyrophosphatase (non-canonical NTP hydrolase)
MNMENLKEIQRKSYQVSVEKGFFKKDTNIGQVFAQLHSEVSEAYEAHRNNKVFNNNIQLVNGWTDDKDFKESFEEHVRGTVEEELADVIITTLQLIEHLNIDIEPFIHAKIRYNGTREYLHGKKY